MQLQHKTRNFLGISVIALTAGCIPSLYPIYTQQDIVQRNEIVGRWVSEEQSQSWEFSERTGGAYQLVYVDKEGRDATFTVHLTEIQDVLFMDLYPVRSGGTENGFYNLHLVSTHTFFRLRLNDDTLSLSFLNPQWLKQHPDALAHVRDDNSVVLTADTAALRGFVAKHLDTKNAFTTPFQLTKVSNE